ncbi:hypothetical protein ACEZDB_36015 [Streptacidiphilus sp. N1-3]|uniref:Chromosome partition protein Smc n=1 Tax=Streptacidiphilus alkalitolerans TaxID=3342712 RepID=A0ABV6XCN8_9ACTN
MSEDWEYELSRLRREVSSLESRFEEEKGSLEGDYSSLDSRVDRLQAEVNGLDRGHTRTVDRVAALERQLAGVAKQVQWLERRARAQAQEEPVDLDAVDERAGVLGAAVREMYEQRELLLSEDDRIQLRRTVREQEQAAQRVVQARKDVVEASRVLARAPLESGEHAAAALKFRVARSTLEGAQTGPQQLLQKRAEQARESLVEDQADVKAAQPVLRAGTAARAELLTRVRTRIADEVARAALLPVWFTTAFGPLPDRQDPQAWLEDATGAVLYRMVYGIDDPVLLLGAEPDDQDQGAQWDQFTQLRQSIAQWAGR